MAVRSAVPVSTKENKQRKHDTVYENEIYEYKKQRKLREEKKDGKGKTVIQCIAKQKLVYKTQIYTLTC